MKKAEVDLQKHTLNLQRGDYARLQELYPDIGAATIIRRVVHAFIGQIEQQGAEIDAEVEIKI